jgi:hypothetical protein
MDYDTFETPSSVRLNIPRNQDYRTCSECSSDCSPGANAIDGIGLCIASVCAEHGVQSIVDPFNDERYERRLVTS